MPSNHERHRAQYGLCKFPDDYVSFDSVWMEAERVGPVHHAAD
jgi:hypothetical protein